MRRRKRSPKGKRNAGGAPKCAVCGRGSTAQRAADAVGVRGDAAGAGPAAAMAGTGGGGRGAEGGGERDGFLEVAVRTVVYLAQQPPLLRGHLVGSHVFE